MAKQISNTPRMKAQDLKELLDGYYEQFHVRDFIEHDPVSIPHRFSTREDIEIMGFFAAVLAWGQRKTIINKCLELEKRMDGKPFEFITSSKDSDLKQLLGFKHRTFNDTDLLYFVASLQNIYASVGSLEAAFKTSSSDATIEGALIHFNRMFFSLEEVPQRTRKHISSPAKNSACKRLVMFLRWMVRRKGQVDFGLWKSIRPSQLVCPCDVHVDRVARKLNLIQRPSTDWQTALELTNNLRKFDPKDPVKYDFALFGMGLSNY